MCITMENTSQSVRKKQYCFLDVQVIHTTYLIKHLIKQNPYHLYPQSTPLYTN